MWFVLETIRLKRVLFRENLIQDGCSGVLRSQTQEQPVRSRTCLWRWTVTGVQRCKRAHSAQTFPRLASCCDRDDQVPTGFNCADTINCSNFEWYHMHLICRPLWFWNGALGFIPVMLCPIARSDAKWLFLSCADFHRWRSQWFHLDVLLWPPSLFRLWLLREYLCDFSAVSNMMSAYFGLPEIDFHFNESYRSLKILLHRVHFAHGNPVCLVNCWCTWFIGVKC